MTCIAKRTMTSVRQFYVRRKEKWNDISGIRSFLSARLDKQRAKFEKEKVQIDEKIAEKTKELENKRRKGECGRAWQVLQQRIDMGKTCEEDILAGIDKSPEAREVRGYLAQNMSYVRDSVEDADDEDNEAAQARVALDKGMTRLREWESQYAAQRNQAS